MLKLFPVLLLLMFLSPLPVSAQCSDAGACAIGGMDTHEKEAVRHLLALRYAFGSSGTPDDIRFHTVLVEGSAELIPGSRIAARLPYSVIDGPKGSTSGIGDLTLLWDQRLWRSDGLELRAQAGVKLPTGDDDAGMLPQAYQAGLGTTDLIAGLSLDAAPWSAAVGYQYSDGRSDNALTRLRRGDDLLLRAGYGSTIDDYGFGLEVIAIQRLALSTIVNPEPGSPDAFIAIPGSDQLQVNVLGTASAPLSDQLRLSVLAAVPLLKRDINIDGLKRTLTLSAGFELLLGGD